jgi:hypothetical protein
MSDAVSDRRGKPSPSRRGADPDGHASRTAERVVEREAPPAPKRLSPRLFGRWWTVLVLILLIVLVGMSLWRFGWLRPYLAGLGAGLAAFIAPLPALIEPGTRGKWWIAVGLACIVGLGTWFSTDAIQREKDRFEGQAVQLKGRFQSQNEGLESWLKRLPGEQQAAFLLYGQGHLLGLYRKQQFQEVVDFAQLLAAVDQGNGHALYFEGEGYRTLGQRTNMRGAFRRYLQIADHHPESTNGDAYSCSARPAGYCGERTEWVSHLMANDYLRQARTGPRGQAFTSLTSAFDYEKRVLSTRPKGFELEGTMASSCTVLQGITSEFATLHQPRPEVEALLKGYHTRFGPC